MNRHLTSLRLVLTGYAAIVLMLAGTFGYTALTASVDGPTSADAPGMKFSHKLHVKDAGVACADCHASAPTSVLSADNLRAGHANCESCHSEQIEKTCTFCHTSEDPAEYVAAVPGDRELVFSHQQHIQVQSVACETCHAGIDAEEAPVGDRIPTMSTCNACHDNVAASNACETCHTNLVALRPAEHNRTDFASQHRKVAQKLDANCSSCHAEETCQECHNGTELQKVNLPGNDLQTPHAPRLMTFGKGKVQTALNVHDGNFRFTHGLAARGKAQECQTCHDQQEFCSTCHFAGGNINQEVFKPASHDAPGFVTIGVGTGGGAHSRLAKKDMESCASCHDAAGADPTCVTCHADNDGVRFTNPKTHAAGFMRGVEGEWHENAGANCYVCHTDPNARPGGIPGKNFCGYCHN